MFFPTGAMDGHGGPLRLLLAIIAQRFLQQVIRDLVE
jgi:hypothetical protein